MILTFALYALSPFLVMFSFRGEANQLLMDSGVSTLLLSGWVLACLGASNVVRREIEEQTYQAFELFAVEELPAAEVAERLGITPNAVYGAKRRVMERLKELRPVLEEDF